MPHAISNCHLKKAQKKSFSSCEERAKIETVFLLNQRQIAKQLETALQKTRNQRDAATFSEECRMEEDGDEKIVFSHSTKKYFVEARRNSSKNEGKRPENT